HSFTLDMAKAIGDRIVGNKDKASELGVAITNAYRIVFQRDPSPKEIAAASSLIEKHGIEAFSRALLNANELLYLE
ncbi:MAG: hypothetical protein ACK5RF_07905, partial [Pirellula sp.]